MKIYVLARKVRETRGHGDFGESYQLATTEQHGVPVPYPAFKDLHAAAAYIDNLEPFIAYGLVAVGTELM